MSLFDYITWSTVALATSLLLTFKVVKFIYGEWSSPLNILPGPKSSSLLFGNLKQIWNSVSWHSCPLWRIVFYIYTGTLCTRRTVAGRVWACRGLQGLVWRMHIDVTTTTTYLQLQQMNQLFTIDHKVVNHILMNPDLYQKPVAARKNMERIMGPGLLVVEGEPHRRQVCHCHSF